MLEAKIADMTMQVKQITKHALTTSVLRPERKYTIHVRIKVVTDLQQIVGSDIRMRSQCLFPVVVTSLKQVVITLLQG